MGVLRENTVILDGLAETSNLFSHVIALFKHLVKCHGDLIVFISLVQVELDRAGVCVPVLDSPFLRLALHILESLSTDLDVV